MSRSKRIELCLLVVFALCALTAPAASAASPAWWVNGSLLGLGATDAVAEATTVKTAFTIKSTVVSGECKVIKVKEGDIEGEKKAAVQSLVFSECVDLTDPTHCFTTGFSTKPLSIALEGTKGNLKLKFKPTTGTEVFTITVTGSSCTHAGTFHVTGTMTCTYPNVETEAERHELLFTNTSGSKLEVSGVELELVGDDLFWLSSKLNWSAK